MKESNLEIKTKKSVFKTMSDYVVVKLMGYLMDGIPISKNVSADNRVVYGR